MSSDELVFDALDNIPNALVVYDDARTVIYCNKSFRVLYGYSAEQCGPGTHHEDLLKLDIKSGVLSSGNGKHSAAEFFRQKKEYEKNLDGYFDFQFLDGRWIRYSENLTTSSNVVSIQRDITDRILREEQEKNAQALYRAAFDANNNIGSITVMETGRFLDVNDAWCYMTGYNREEAIGKTALELNIWGNPDNRQKLLNALSENTELEGFASQVRSRSGEMRDLDLNSKVVTVNGIDCLFLSCVDVTEKLRVEKAAHAGEKRIQAVFDNAPIGMALYDAESCQSVIANQRYFEIIGRSAEDLKTEDWTQFTHPEDLAEDLKLSKKIRKQEIPGYEMEKRYLHKDGTVVWVNLVIVGIEPDDKNRFKNHLVMITDITGKKATEEALDAVRDRLNDFTKVGADWYWELDPDERFTYISSPVTSTTGLSQDDYVGKNALEILERDSDDPQSFEEFRASIRNRQPFRGKIYSRKNAKTGKKMWIRASGMPVFGPHEKFLGYRGASTDVTEHMELEEKLIQSQKMEAVGQLTGGIAHDFNNILTVILGNADLMKEALDEGVGVPESHVNSVLKAASRGAELTHSMLAFSRTQSLWPKVFHLDDCVNNMVNMLARTLGETIQIKTDFDKNLWSCFADQGKVENTLLNLCINARDAMQTGGSLIIELRNAVLDDDYANMHEEVSAGKYVSLIISDTGTGMTEEALERAFEPFYTTKEIGKGTGLGLSMVYGFVRQSKGHITIYSELGIGTTVKLFLPYCDTEKISPN